MARVLTRRERHLVGALAETLFPLEGPIPVDAAMARVVDYVDGYLAAAPRPERTQLRALFALFELAHVVQGRARPRPFSSAPADSRSALMAAWSSSPLYPQRAAFQALRSLLSIAWVADAEVGRQMGYGDGAEAVRAWNSRKKQGGTGPSA